MTLKDEFSTPIKGAKISVKIKSAKTITTDKNGKAKLTTNALAPKSSYTAKITFAGDTNHIKSTKSVKITVKKATPKLTAKAKSSKRTVKTKKYQVTLKTNKNKAMKKTKITLKVNGKTYHATTNKYGKAIFKITKLTKKGKFTAVIKYNGSKYYKTKTVKVKLTIK